MRNKGIESIKIALLEQRKAISAADTKKLNQLFIEMKRNIESIESINFEIEAAKEISSLASRNAQLIEASLLGIRRVQECLNELSSPSKGFSFYNVNQNYK